MEGAVLNSSGLNKNVPRVEYDHRAREARFRLEQPERLLVVQDAKDFRTFRLFRLVRPSVFASVRRGNGRTGSPSDQRPCDIPMLLAPQVA
jgi:hypothetical protein